MIHQLQEQYLLVTQFFKCKISKEFKFFQTSNVLGKIKNVWIGEFGKILYDIYAHTQHWLLLFADSHLGGTERRVCTIYIYIQYTFIV